MASPVYPFAEFAVSDLFGFALYRYFVGTTFAEMPVYEWHGNIEYGSELDAWWAIGISQQIGIILHNELYLDFDKRYRLIALFDDFFDRSNHPGITRAPANMSAKHVADFFLIWLGANFKKSLD